MRMCEAFAHAVTPSDQPWSGSPGRQVRLRASRQLDAVVELVERDLVLEHDDPAARVLRQGPGPVPIALLALHHPALGIDEQDQIDRREVPVVGNLGPAVVLLGGLRTSMMTRGFSKVTGRVAANTDSPLTMVRSG